ncbi:MAG: secretin N-terminal domain-containing protein, partial [Steroidobacteraceae bacterium]
MKLRPTATASLFIATLLATATLAPLTPANAQELQIIELHHRLADDVLPVLQPLLAEGGVLTGLDGLLFVRTTPANLEQVRAAIAAIDRAPRQLLITVGQDTASQSSSAGARGAVVIGNDSGASVRVGGGSQRADLANVSSIRTLEGNETYIAVGQSAPYREADTGFYATARVSGNTVTLEVSPRQQRFTGRGRVEGGGGASTVSMPLGEWIEFGAVRETSSGSTSGLLVWGRHGGASEYSAWVKV